MELIKASGMKKTPTDWTNLTPETPGIRVTQLSILVDHSYSIEGCSETNISVPLSTFPFRLFQEENSID